MHSRLSSQASGRKGTFEFHFQFQTKDGLFFFALNKVVNAENLFVQRLSSEWVHRQLRADNHSDKSSLIILLHG